MKRIMLAAMGLVCLLMVGKVQADCTGTIFSDVSQASVGYSMCDYIERFSVLGITSGYPDGTYRPGSSVTRGQMAAFVMRAIDNVVQSQIKVFDANDQYLGNLNDVTDHDLDVFIPSLIKKIWISPMTGDLRETYHLFESNDCTGQAYIDYRAGMFSAWRNSGHYYTGVNTIPTQINAQSYREEGICGDDFYEYDVLPVQEITIPFTTPVALPIRLE